ncbi:MAG: GntR family transcriptional regulator MpaR [Wenzhouxiangellaceae bacterium]
MVSTTPVQPVNTDEDTFLYQQVVERISRQIHQGGLAPGERLPSLRQLSKQLQLSVPTVRQAYLELERQGLLEARPKSGYFVQALQRRPLVSSGGRENHPCQVRCRQLLDRVMQGIHRPDTLPLSIANPSMALPATKALHRTMKRVMARTQERSLTYAPHAGEPGLRWQVAHRYQQQFEQVDPDQVIITNGAQEALAIALQCSASAGAIIAVEAPCYHGHLELIESLGMLALEIETDPLTGVSLDCLRQALDQHNIAACLFSSALNNPLGSLSNDEDRRQLVAMLEARDIPLIEDDVYGELVFSGRRPPLARQYSERGLVLTCSSFAKTLAPGFRVGWLLAGRYHDRASKLKRALSCSSGLLQQLTLAEFIANGDYDRHLRRLLPVLQSNAQRMRAMIESHFPAHTRVSQPHGGSVLWLEMDPTFDSDSFFDQALAAGVSIMPGALFSADQRFNHYLRISYGHPWSEQLEEGIARLGQLAGEITASH